MGCGEVGCGEGRMGTDVSTCLRLRPLGYHHVSCGVVKLVAVTCRERLAPLYTLPCTHTRTHACEEPVRDIITKYLNRSPDTTPGRCRDSNVA